MQFPRDDWTIRSVVTIIGFFQGTILFPPPPPLSPSFTTPKTFCFHGSILADVSRQISRSEARKKCKKFNTIRNIRNVSFAGIVAVRSPRAWKIIIYFFFFFFSMRHPSSHPSRNPSERFLTFREPFNVSFSVVAPTSVRKRERAATPSLARGGRKEISEIKRRRYSPAFFGRRRERRERVGGRQLSRKPVLFAINYLREAKRLAWENERGVGQN